MSRPKKAGRVRIGNNIDEAARKAAEELHAFHAQRNDSEATKDIIQRFVGDRPDDAMHTVVGKLLGTIPRYPPLSSDIPILERIKIYAQTGFLHRADGTEEDFERIWREAFPDTEMEKGGKK